MVSLCDCEEYFHVEEIKEWVRKRLRKKVKNKTINYYFEIAQCEKKEENNEKEIFLKNNYIRIILTLIFIIL